MFTVDLKGKTGLVLGVANQKSIAWAIAQELHAAGARLGFTYQGDRLEGRVKGLAGGMNPELPVMECDVTNDGQIEEVVGKMAGALGGGLDYLVHSVAFARKEDLEGSYLNTSRDGFKLALEVSAYSLLGVSRAAAPYMEKSGGSIVTLTYMASQRVFPSYNVMGTAKAALEHGVRQLAFELGPRGIRVNAISAGPLNTLSARGVSGFLGMLNSAKEKAPLKRCIEAREVGQAALFLLSDMASGITGEVLYVDAGYNIMGT